MIGLDHLSIETERVCDEARLVERIDLFIVVVRECVAHVDLHAVDLTGLVHQLDLEQGIVTADVGHPGSEAS